MRAVSVVHLLICKCIFVKGNEDMIIKKTTSFRSLMGFIVTVSCQPNLLLETTFGNKSQLLNFTGRSTTTYLFLGIVKI